MGNKVGHDWTIQTWDHRDRCETLLSTINITLARAAYEAAIAGTTIRPGQIIALCHGAQIMMKHEPG